jgi:hypothetical protein
MAKTQVTVVFTIEHDSDVDPARAVKRALEDDGLEHAVARSLPAGSHVYAAQLGTVVYGAPIKDAGGGTP